MCAATQFVALVRRQRGASACATSPMRLLQGGNLCWHVRGAGGGDPEGGPQVKVIGAGFGRTGTLSLKVALEELGFGPCYHMVELFDKPDHVEFWDEAADRVARGEPVGWEDVFSGYEATVDWPGCYFYEELMQAYPDAKVLLSVRDPESWYDSAWSTIARGPRSGASPARSLFFKVGQLAVPSMRRVPSMVSKVITDGTFDGRFEEREYAVKVFERHVYEVKKRAPAEKLLVYEVREGWGPLCEFLGVEAPEKPFPHLNDRGEFPKMMRRQMLRALAPAIGRTVAAASLLLAALWVLWLVYPGSRSARRRIPGRPRTPALRRRPGSSG